MKHERKICKLILFEICAVLAVQAVFSHGAKDIEEISVENLESWQESFTLEGKKKGKYNILVTATDLGGNEFIEGPYNIYVDPKSDLPVCGITNPHQDMRIMGNLNIVGTCVDDDAVQYVDLILDGDEEHPVRASGKEFWSYYLDTTELSEGVHSIKVIGTDINGLAGNPVSLTWNLDRRQPVTEVQNRSMGELVSGTVKFSGAVSDGNGIKNLAYSVDNGETFKDIRLSEKKGIKYFTISVDTRKFKDGPAVIWFKALDNAGSTGVYSFLYFIDNTKPDIQIVTPEEKEVQYGKVAVSGIAKDAIGVTKLTWTFGKETGEFDLVPGNPYWSIVFDTIGSSDSSRKFTITGEDRAGNVVSVSRNILLNQKLDKPVVEIVYPTVETFLETNEKCFVRGIAKDREGIQSVKYRIDNNDWIIEETKGVFCGDLIDGSELSPGKHTVTVVATDRNGVEGDPFSVTFTARGAVPSFSELRIIGGKNTRAVEAGMSVHPEDGASFQITASSGLGLSAVSAEVRWGKDGSVLYEYTPNGGTSQNIVIPLGADCPKGVVRIYVSATDTAGRTKNYKTMFRVINTSVVTSNTPAVVFDDSTVSADGVIINNKEFPASGYFIGGNARTAEIVPSTPFAKAELHGNQIVLVPGSATGSSEKVVVRVTTDQGLRYESRQIVFKNDTSFPVVKINQASEDSAVDGSAGELTVTGTVSCDTGIGKLGYRIFSARAAMANGAVNALEPVVKSELTELPASRSFSIPFNALELGYGIYFIEVVAESAGGNTAASAVYIRNIPELGTLPNGKAAVAKAPMFVWADGVDVYYGAAYQGELDRSFGAFKRSDMTFGSNALTATVTAAEKPYSSKYTASRDYELSAVIASINGSAYMSGMPVEVPFGSSATLTAYIDTAAAVSSVNYEITGEAVPGGSNQSGSVKTVKALDGTDRYTVEIPLSGLPVRVNTIKISVKAAGLSYDLTGSFEIVRPLDKEKTDDLRAVYAMETDDTFFDTDTGSYIMNTGIPFNFYANVPELADAALVTAMDGLVLERNGNNVSVKAEKDGSYRGVQVRVKDINGISYTSQAVNFIVDSGAPEVVISTPQNHSWVKRSIRITGTAVDPSGVKNGEYSIDGGVTWSPLSLSVTKGAQGATFSATADISNLEDGLIGLDVRVFDTAGHVSYARTAVHRDTTPPEVEIVLPGDEAVVNGDNLIAFRAYDDGSLEKIYYIAPPGAKVPQSRVELEYGNFVTTHIGTADKPIDDAMSFEFVDDAGNVATIESYKFMIDSKSDLPVAEIHLPGDNEVITRDFTISGVVYDDDGPSMVYYRIDRGEYIRVEDPLPPPAYDENGTEISVDYDQKRTSFAIPIDFSTMVDNEHTIYVYAVDTNGVKGPVAERVFRVSTEEPKGAVVTPSIDTSVKNVITISGNASDKNGIAKVQVSLDNGNSYNDAVGTEEWSYTFDTRAIPNGTNVVFIKVFDKYGIQGLYSSLINIDNLAPEMILDYPLDYSATTGPLFFSGYAFDNVNITEMFVTVRSLDGKSVPRSMQRVNFELERIIAKTLDLSLLENGSYNIELTALDKAGNATHVSRNVMLNKNKPLAVVDLLYPLNGEHKQGVFNIYGEASADKPIESLALYIDDTFIADTQLLPTGYFKFAITPEIISAGTHRYRVDARVEGGSVIKSRVQTVEYSNVGPWITIDNFSYGDFAIDRPYIEGHAGYSLDEDELLLSKMKKATKEQKDAINSKKVEKIEVSFDNGKTFVQVSKAEKWMYRVENHDLPEGFHFMLVRATMRNGEVAIDRAIIQIDNTSPKVRLIAPDSGGRYNQQLVFSGLSSDNIGLKDVTLSLRKGDKASYQVPSFIQGLYFDWKFWGATLFDIGVGLTFFDDVVKVQFQWGQFTQAQRDIFSKSDMRYGGDNVMGIKILANVANIPFAYFFGRDFEWLSANIAVGANFTRFNESASGEAQILSALLAQVEFPKVTFPQLKMFSTFSLYTEFSLWFIPTDVISSGSESIKNLVPQISEGIRVNLF